MAEITKVDASQAGCWIGGGWGWLGSIRVIEIAESHGFPMDDDDKALVEANRGVCVEPLTLSTGQVVEPDLIGELVSGQGEMADKAETWLNDNVAPEGYSFGWHDGEFYLWSTADWCDVSGDICQCDEPHGGETK